LFFGASADLDEALEKIERRATGGVKVVLLRVKYARNLDGVCLDILERFVQRMTAGDVVVILCGVRAGLLKVIRNAGWDQRLGSDRIFPEGPALWSSTLQAVDRAYEMLGADRCITCPLRSSTPAEARNWNYMI
jgi:MFS superfamily sulfate permease-like transporter